MTSDFDYMNVPIAIKKGIIGDIVIFLNGVQVEHSLAAKAGCDGWVHHHDISSDGKPVLDDSGEDIKSTKSHGEVVIKCLNHYKSN